MQRARAGRRQPPPLSITEVVIEDENEGVEICLTRVVAFCLGFWLSKLGITALLARFRAYPAQVLIFDHAAAEQRAVGLAAAGDAVG